MVIEVKEKEIRRLNGQWYLVLNLHSLSNIQTLPFPLNLGISGYQWFLQVKRSYIGNVHSDGENVYNEPWGYMEVRHRNSKNDLK